MNDLQAIESELNRLYVYKNDIETGRRPYNQWEYNDLNDTIYKLSQARENFINQMRYTGNQYNNGYYPNNNGYIDPRYQQQNNNSLINRNGFGTPSQPMGYYPPNMTSSGSDDGNNRFAKKAASIPQAQVFQQQQPVVQQRSQPVQQEQLKPAEGSEFYLITGPGLECRKEVQNGWYRYEVYGSLKTILDPKTEDLATTIQHVQDAKKFCLEKSLDGVTGKILKSSYGKTNANVKFIDIIEKVKCSSIPDTIIATREISKNIAKYLEVTFTDIVNKCLVGGLKKRQKLESIVGDLDDMSNIIKADSVRMQTYYNTLLDSMRNDIQSNISYERHEEVYCLKDSIPFIYIESDMLLGNAEEVMRNNDIACVTKDSNPGLFSVFKQYFDKDPLRLYTVLYTINDIQEVSKFIVCKDINNNFIMAK